MSTFTVSLSNESHYVDKPWTAVTIRYDTGSRMLDPWLAIGHAGS